MKPYILTQVEPFIYNQTTPVNEVIIQHNKNKLCPSVILIDEDGYEFYTEIQYIDYNKLRIKTNTPVIFTAYIY